MRAGTLKLAEHTNLIGEELFDLGWYPQDVDARDIDIVMSMTGYEMRAEYLDDDPAQHVAAEEEMEGIFWQLSERCLGGTFLIAVEHSVLPKGRRRSFLGFFPYRGAIKAGEHKEIEFDHGRESSFFMGMAPVTSENRKECFAIGRAFTRAFWVGPGSDREAAYSLDLLRSLRPFLDKKGRNTFDFWRLIPFLCRRRYTVVRFGRDAGEQYINLRVFSPRRLSMEALRGLDPGVGGRPLP